MAIKTRPLRWCCYGTMALVASAAAIMWGLKTADVCSRFDEAAIQCSSPVYEALGSYSLTVIMLAVFGVFISLPAIIGGLVFLMIDLSRLWRRRS